jgi:hypothetical protein
MNTDVRMGLRLFCVADTLAQEEEQMATYSPAPVRQGPKFNIDHTRVINWVKQKEAYNGFLFGSFHIIFNHILKGMYAI